MQQRRAAGPRARQRAGEGRQLPRGHAPALPVGVVGPVRHDGPRDAEGAEARGQVREGHDADAEEGLGTGLQQREVEPAGQVRGHDGALAQGALPHREHVGRTEAVPAREWEGAMGPVRGGGVAL